VKNIAAKECIAACWYDSRPYLSRSYDHALGDGLGSVIKKRRKKMRKHKHKKMLKKTRWQRRAHA
jgi:mRNA-processing protein COX24